MASVSLPCFSDDAGIVAAEMWFRGAVFGEPGSAALGLGAWGLVMDTDAGV